MRDRPHGYRSVTQLARYCGVTTQAVKNWIREGKIPEPELVHNGTRLWSTEQAREILTWHSEKSADRTALPPTALMRVAIGRQGRSRS